MNEHERGQVTNSAAAIYEQFFVPALFADWPTHVLNAAQVQPGDSVLDVACGTGVLACAAAARVGSTGTVTGVDINKGMLTVAQQKAPQITWKVSPAEALPFEDNRFERVVSQFGLMFFTDQVKALAEMRRVLKPGGRIAIAVWSSLEATPGYQAVATMLHELFGSQAAQSIQAPYALGNTQKLTSLFAAAGLDNVSVETILGQARFASVEDWLYTDIKGWTLADNVSDADYEKLKQYAPQKLAPFVLADGSVAFDAPAHVVTAY